MKHLWNILGMFLYISVCNGAFALFGMWALLLVIPMSVMVITMIGLPDEGELRNDE